MGKVSFITTVLNEEKTIKSFLDSLYLQSKKPDEIIIVDGGSSDSTLEIIKNHEINNNLEVKLYKKEGNISKGRNFAVKKSTGEIIAISDAGCILDKNWLKNITNPFEDKSIDVVAGFYKGEAQNNFQKNLIPYVLVMPDKVNKNFFPAARSMAIKRKVFMELGGFLEKLNYGEDFDLAKRLKKAGKKNIFERKAQVSWIPRNTLKDAFRMFFRYAKGDISAGNLRTKVILIFARYLFVLITLLVVLLMNKNLFIGLVVVYFISYSLWSVSKNYKYVRNSSAFLYLPLIQLVSDVAVILGSLVGAIKRFKI